MSRPQVDPVEERQAMDAARRRADELLATSGGLVDGVERYCLFIGYARSGHTLLGSLLDAHPHAVVANELDALRYVEGGLDRRQLFVTIAESARSSADAGRTQTGYSYDVPGGHQGCSDDVRVIGDKKGGVSTRRLAADPGLLDALHERVAVPLRVLHVTRNPFDNIARIHLRSGRTLEGAIRRYFKFVDWNAELRGRLAPDELLDVRLEEFIAAPRDSLAAVCDFVGLSATPDYLDAASSIVFPSPKRARDKIDWPVDVVTDIASRIAEQPFLRGYTFA
jgi:hypothetical protein